MGAAPKPLLLVFYLFKPARNLFNAPYILPFPENEDNLKDTSNEDNLKNTGLFKHEDARNSSSSYTTHIKPHS